MEWEIQKNDNPNFLEIKTSGLADKDSSIQLAKSIAESMKKNRITKALVDHTKITGVSGSIVEIYERPKLFKTIDFMLEIKIAEIIQTKHREHFSFLETVCVNKGYSLSIFSSRKKAIEWLMC